MPTVVTSLTVSFFDLPLFCLTLLISSLVPPKETTSTQVFVSGSAFGRNQTTHAHLVHAEAQREVDTQTHVRVHRHPHSCTCPAHPVISLSTGTSHRALASSPPQTWAPNPSLWEAPFNSQEAHVLPNPAAHLEHVPSVSVVLHVALGCLAVGSHVEAEHGPCM